MPELVRVGEVFLFFIGVHVLSSSDEEGEFPGRFYGWRLGPFGGFGYMATPNPVVDGEDISEFLKALEKRSSHFSWRGEKGKQVSEYRTLPPYLLNASLR